MTYDAQVRSANYYANLTQLCLVGALGEASLLTFGLPGLCFLPLIYKITQPIRFTVQMYNMPTAPRDEEVEGCMARNGVNRENALKILSTQLGKDFIADRKIFADKYHILKCLYWRAFDVKILVQDGEELPLEEALVCDHRALRILINGKEIKIPQLTYDHEASKEKLETYYDNDDNLCTCGFYDSSNLGLYPTIEALFKEKGL